MGVAALILAAWFDNLLIHYALPAVAACAIVLHVVNPLKSRRSYRVAEDPRYEEVNASDPRIPDYVRLLWSDLEPELRKLNFLPATCLIDHRTFSGTVVYHAIWGDPDAGVTCHVNSHSNGATSQHVITFGSSFEGEGEVTTDNSSEPAFTPVARSPRHHSIPCLGDLALLLKVHRMLAARAMGTREPSAAPREGFATALHSDTRASVEWWAARGWVYGNGSGYLQFRPLPWLLCMWGHIPPFSSVRRWLLKHRGRTLLRELHLPADYKPVDYSRYRRPLGPGPALPASSIKCLVGHTPQETAELLKDEYPLPVLDEHGCAPAPFQLDTNGRISEALNCLDCGYSLLGIDPNSRCPECGQKVGYSRVGSMLRLAPLLWVYTWFLGASGIVLPFFGLGVASIVLWSSTAADSLRTASGPLTVLGFGVLIASAIGAIKHWDWFFYPDSERRPGLLSVCTLGRQAVWVCLLYIVVVIASGKGSLGEAVAGLLICSFSIILLLEHARGLALRMAEQKLARYARALACMIGAWFIVAVPVLAIQFYDAMSPSVSWWNAVQPRARFVLFELAPACCLFGVCLILWKLRNALWRVYCEIYARAAPPTATELERSASNVLENAE